MAALSMFIVNYCSVGKRFLERRPYIDPVTVDNNYYKNKNSTVHIFLRSSCN